MTALGPSRRPAADARRRRLVFTLLYFSEGAPIGYIWWTLPVVLTRAGVPAERVGVLLAWVVLPWTLKFLWAPLVDVLRGPRFGLRGWIAAAQCGMLLTLLPLVWIDPASASEGLVTLLVLHAVAAATQDVAIDTLAIATTAPAERGALNGWMQVGMLGGRSVFGGVALVARERVGDGPIVGALCAVLAVSLALRGLLPAEPRAPGSALPWRARAVAFRASLAQVLRRRSVWLMLLFAATGAVAFESVGAFAGPFLVERGLADASIGRFFALPAVAGLAGGALAGGWISDRLGRLRTVAAGGLLVALAALTFALTPPGTGSWIALSAVYLGAGVMTSSTYALFMDHTDPRLGATQFSAAMGATNLCEAWSARLTGRLGGAHGYPVAFAVASALGLLALPLLPFLRPRAHPRDGA